ncbi:chemotaxis protein [Shewanella algae]|uniref:methyl-accepting chemotaxis protein n=1 Tax=Shewanella algae TaxID=38313 RepID=UPI001645E8D7|nr:methyl-accepting chemotaxis protein [Shewanella algae]TWO82349.1 chemotaxis protein [Shewanella algae]
MSNFNLRNKLLVLTLMPLFLVSTLMLLTLWIIESNALESEIDHVKEKLLEERRLELIHMTEVTKEIVSSQQSHGGDYKAILQNIRFGSTGYFYIYDSKGNNLFHALQPEQEGTNQIGMTDPKGTRIIVGLLNAARNGDGFLTYYYQKPGANKLVEKIGYAAIIPNTDWIIGTGAYMDDIDSSVAKFRQTEMEYSMDRLWLTLMIAITTILVTVISILFIAKRAIDPIRNMLSNLNDIAQGEGDLTKRLQVHGEDEIAQLGRAFNRFVDKLQHIIGNVTTTTQVVQDASSSINAQTQAIVAQLANHNNETEQVVTAITEMSSAAHEVALNTNQVAEATYAAANEVAKAQECVDISLTEISTLMAEVDSAADHIQSLNEQSQKINSVLSVIGSIAEQTNLLALNAAIEAARAGEHGRGFAVVADEVRGLANRTQASTQEINEMLSELHRLVSLAVTSMEESQQSCHRSVESSRLISESLGAVTNSVTTISDMSTQIATAATEQSSVTEEISRNIYAIQEIVAELLHSSEEAARVSQTVSQNGDDLGQLMSQFRV